MTDEELDRRLHWLESAVTEIIKAVIFGFSIFAAWAVVSVVQESLGFKLPEWGRWLAIGSGAMLLTGIIGHRTFKNAPTSVQIVLEQQQRSGRWFSSRKDNR
jgi:hypothetical protein